MDVVAEMDVSPNNVRVGAISYSTTASVSFFLDDNNNARDVQNAIDDNVQFLGGATNTADGIRLLRESFFQ